MDGTIRVRTAAWFATAVVLSVFATVLVMQTWRVDAAPGDSDSTFVPIANCRLFDYRTGTNNVGPKNTPLGSGESKVHTQSVHGTNGDCTIPSDAVGVAMNVTVVSPTAQSHLRVFPADIKTPNASNLNWLPGQSPTPNKVDVKLSPDGKIKLYNHAGTVNVLADVVGYYTNSMLLQITEQLAVLQKSQSFAVTNYLDDEVSVNGEVFVPVTVTAPVAGQVTLNSTTQASHAVVDEGGVACVIVKAADGPFSFVGESVHTFMNHGAKTEGTMSGTRTFDIAAGAVVEYGLACGTFGDSGGMIKSPNLTAIFTPAP